MLIDQDPNKYLSYFKRAATYLSLGRSTNALQDFTKILEIKPDFDQALLQRAKIYLKDGSLTEEKRDLQKYLKKNDKEADAKQLVIINVFFFNKLLIKDTLINN